MSNGWHLSIVTEEAPTEEHARLVLEKLRDDMRLGFGGGAPGPGLVSGSIIWVTTSPDGRPLFVQIVLGSDNFHENPRGT
jgi:hypothetical protein